MARRWERQVVEVENRWPRVQLAKMTDEFLAAETRHVAVGLDEVVGQLRTLRGSQSRFAVLLTLRQGPFDDPAWLFEPKYDGYAACST